MLTKRFAMSCCFAVAITASTATLRAEDAQTPTLADEPAGTQDSGAATVRWLPPLVPQAGPAEPVPTRPQAEEAPPQPLPPSRRFMVVPVSAPATPPPPSPTDSAVPSGPETVEPARTDAKEAGHAAADSGGSDGDREPLLGRRWRNTTKPRLQYHYWGYAPFFREPGLGAQIYPLLNAQIGAGLAEQLVLYDYDFNDNGTAPTLNEHGMRQLCKMAKVMSHCDYSLIIEHCTDRPGLDEARRAAVLAAARNFPVPVPEDRVVVACPEIPGLRGTEAEITDINLLRQTLNGMQQRTYSSAAAFSALSGSGTGTSGPTP